MKTRADGPRAPGAAIAAVLHNAALLKALSCAAVGILALGASHAAALERQPLDPRLRQIETFRSVPQDGDRLAFRGGLVFSGEKDLHGLSGMVADGNELLIVSDYGHWVGGRLQIEDGRLTGFVDVWRAPMRLQDGSIATGKEDGDAESVALRGDEIVVTFERPGRALSYRKADGAWAPTDGTPTLLTNLRKEFGPQLNQPESAFFDSDGDIFIINEEPTYRDGARGVQLPSELFAVALQDPWRVTGADLGPAGDLFIVERRYEGGTDVGMRVRRIGTETMERALWDGPILIEGDFSDQIDNMEAITAINEDGEIAITLVSDDNSNVLQRGLILRFVVSDPLPQPNPMR